MNKEKSSLVSLVFKIVGGACVIGLLYLFALNDRYTRINSRVVLDKWTQECRYADPVVESSTIVEEVSDDDIIVEEIRQ